MFKSPEEARELGRKAGLRSGQVRRKRLTLADVEEALPPLDTPEHIRVALERVQRWATGGLLPGSVAGAAVRACEAALKLYELQVDNRIKDLETQIAELEAKLGERAALRRLP